MLQWMFLMPTLSSLSLITRSITTTTRCSINCHRTSTARIGRLTYTRTYPTLLVQSDGSTINIRYHEPRKIVKLPLDLSTLTEAERRKRLEARKPKVKVVLEDDIEDDFKVTNYEHLWKK
ncbi:39S ribosomal protein L55, mitochondrial-like isoform X4 [Eriocheir sinensis]|uniref:39S ribosomal protein L55, mitochondrial-like isoform X4 n=1 Tax=Eriocheir sinensis TaxID=95602 RepID=UPI0021C6B415|nr:39S ribosomal protein L55, mitochondrial-like isoform X4 [Eriocheir sinensis]